jgi:hypothetical protein
MSNEMNNLFAAVNESTNAGNRGLSGTAQLTSIASNIASQILNEMNANIDEFIEDIKASQVDNNAMDKLIERVNPLVDVDVDFLKELDDDVVDGMLKSQQSKRSRCKSKAMTMDNYRALMTGAIAENLIRIATGKEKHSGGTRRMAGSVDYTIEQLEALSEDQEALRREIRNVQSKKSIMKSKADFDENDERYQSLLRAEKQLKDMRISGSSVTVVEVDKCADAVSELLHGVDIQHLKLNEAKELLERIEALVTFGSDSNDTDEATMEI